MENISSILCRKYFKFKKKDRNISLMMLVCFLGILIGTFSLMLSLIITNGFEKTISEKMQGISSQAIIYSPGHLIDDKSIKNVLLKEFKNQIKAISASSTRQILINKGKQKSVLFIKGIEPNQESKVTTIAQKIRLPLPLKKGEKAQAELLKNLLRNNQMIIGTKTAQNYKIKIGDEIIILIPEAGGKKKILLKKKKVIVSGIFKVGLEEYDNNFAFCSLDYLKQLFDEKQGVDQISLKLTDGISKFSFKKLIEKKYLKQMLLKFLPTQDPQTLTLKKIQHRLPTLHVRSWKDLYPALVSSLKLEKYAMFFILTLITLVACMTMISLLFMYIQQKRRDIAILKSMGLSNKKIRSIFLRIGLKITFLATISGLGLAAIAGYILEKYPFIQLPDVYYISYLPARMEPELFVIVFLATMLLGFLATWIPAKRTKRINIAQVLRQE
ncbi:FtsX-like permease family protein [Candidatus Babeliales bacterium]|nr:FtsX-like permease family protein [Candidatus Babeliales bacterium]